MRYVVKVEVYIGYTFIKDVEVKSSKELRKLLKVIDNDFALKLVSVKPLKLMSFENFKEYFVTKDKPDNLYYGESSRR